MPKLFAPFILALAALFFSGCATVTRGTKDTLVIETDPAGADVRLSSGQSGKTPTSFKLSRKEAVVVTISRDGYETVTVNVNSQVVGAGAAGMAGNVLVGGLIGVGVDALSGATKSLKPNPVTVKLVKLEPKESIAAAPPVAAPATVTPATTPATPTEKSEPTEPVATSAAPEAKPAAAPGGK
ncbi:MAG: hypothetical protein C0518_15950 [Opitutus sp.]|nr:hypothetical protein [Opitutus sp.]